MGRESKKNQISIFIGIGIILISTFIYLITLDQDSKSNERIHSQNLEIDDPGAKSILSYIDACIKLEMRFAYNQALNHNGVFDTSNYNEQIEPPTLLRTDFFEKDHSKTAFVLGDIESFMENYLRKRTPYCIMYLWPFDNESFEMKVKELPQFDVTYVDERFVVDMKFPIKIISNNKVYHVEQFNYKLNSIPLNHLESDVNLILNELHSIAIEEKSGASATFTQTLDNRKDLVVISEQNNSQTIISLYYLSSYWHPTQYIFIVEDQTNN